MATEYFSIPYEFTQHLEKEGGYEEFAVWLKLKILYSNHTIIYNWTYPMLSTLTGISVNTLKKYVPRLIERGWAEDHSGHLLLKGWKKVCGSRTKNSGIIHVTKSMRFNEVKDRLRALSIERDYKAQKFIIGLRTGRLEASTKQMVKWYKKYRDTIQKGEAKESNLILKGEAKESNLILTSTRRIAAQTGLSQSGAYMLARRLTKNKIIRLKPILQLIDGDCNHVPMVETENGFLYWSDRRLYLNKGLSISLFRQ